MDLSNRLLSLKEASYDQNRERKISKEVESAGIHEGRDGRPGSCSIGRGGRKEFRGSGGAQRNQTDDSPGYLFHCTWTGSLQEASPGVGAGQRCSDERRLLELARPSAEDCGSDPGRGRRYRGALAGLELSLSRSSGRSDRDGRGLRQAKRWVRKVCPELRTDRRPLPRHPPWVFECLDELSN